MSTSSVQQKIESDTPENHLRRLLRRVLPVAVAVEHFVHDASHANSLQMLKKGFDFSIPNGVVCA
jgi:hypothetical protein